MSQKRHFSKSTVIRAGKSLSLRNSGKTVRRTATTGKVVSKSASEIRSAFKKAMAKQDVA